MKLLRITDLTNEAVELVHRLRDSTDEEHAVAIVYTALVVSFKSGEENVARQRDGIALVQNDA